jgi:hypothetical protein
MYLVIKTKDHYGLENGSEFSGHAISNTQYEDIKSSGFEILQDEVMKNNIIAYIVEVQTPVLLEIQPFTKIIANGKRER